MYFYTSTAVLVLLLSVYDICLCSIIKKTFFSRTSAYTNYYRSTHRQSTSTQLQVHVLPDYLYIELSENTDRNDGNRLEITTPILQSMAKTGKLGANLGYFYLQKELKLSEHHMVKIMEKYPWIMYLKVDTNLRPTIEVLKSFGFRDKDVRTMLEKVPPILGM